MFREAYVQALAMPAWRRVWLARGPAPMWLRALTAADAAGDGRNRQMPDVAAVLPAVAAAHASQPFTEQTVRGRLGKVRGNVSVEARGLAASFFVDPVVFVWTPGASIVSNGHRIAAARLQGVERLLVARPGPTAPLRSGAAGRPLGSPGSSDR